MRHLSTVPGLFHDWPATGRLMPHFASHAASAASLAVVELPASQSK